MGGQFISQIILIALFGFSAVVSIFKVKHDYNDRKTLSKTSVVLVWTTYLIHTVIVFYAAWKSIWEFHIGILSYVVGGVLALLGCLAYSIALVNFRSFKKMSGLDTSKLIDFGIYRYSRNPQNVGWFLFLLGVAMMGESLLGILFALIFICLFNLYLPIEEKFLNNIFGESYKQYCETTPRYFGFAKDKRHESA